ncbi:MAG: DUF4406 domain-containing protein [Candidatus Buchananbacteria bacterium]
MKKLRIYVCGPITDTDESIVKNNIETARKIGEKILKLGHLPYVPHTHFNGWNLDMFVAYDLFQAHGEDMIEQWADAIFFIAPSNGANLEREKAESLGLKIFTSLEELESLQ